MSDRSSFPLESVLHSPSINEINKLSPYAVKLAKRWAKERPGETRELEASGKLVEVLKQRAEDESLRQWRSRIRAVRGQGDASPGGAQP
ncbi:MAG TPA: hypothetical protein VEH03_02530 [Burkholderiales bacterium]|nr:hypothetical protein [Burkholderiales bacterium]